MTLLRSGILPLEPRGGDTCRQLLAQGSDAQHPLALCGHVKPSASMLTCCGQTSPCFQLHERRVTPDLQRGDEIGAYGNRDCHSKVRR